jgi:hypothetical protein
MKVKTAPPLTLNSALQTVALFSRTPAAASGSGLGWTIRPKRDLSTSIAHHRYVPTYNGYLLPGRVARGNLLMHFGWFLRLALCKLIEHTKLTDSHTSPNDRCEKRARQFRHLPKRFYISLTQKLPMWMHIALCIVGFMSFTVLIWFMLIYGYVRPSPSTAWQTCELRGLPPPKVLPGCLPDSAAIGCCCTPTLLRPSLLSTTFDSAAARIGEESSRFDHTWHRVSFLCNPSHCCSNGSFLKLYPGPSSNTFLLLNLHFASESSKSELLQSYSAEMWMTNALICQKALVKAAPGPLPATAVEVPEGPPRSTD